MIFLIFAQNIDQNQDSLLVKRQNDNISPSLEPPQRSGSNEYPQFLSKHNDKIYVYPCKHINVGFKGV